MVRHSIPVKFDEPCNVGKAHDHGYGTVSVRPHDPGMFVAELLKRQQPDVTNRLCKQAHDYTDNQRPERQPGQYHGRAIASPSSVGTFGSPSRDRRPVPVLSSGTTLMIDGLMCEEETAVTTRTAPVPADPVKVIMADSAG